MVKYKDRVNCNEKVFCTSLFCIFWTFENGTRLVVTLIIKNVQKTLSEYTKMSSWRCKGNTKSHKLQNFCVKFSKQGQIYKHKDR